MRCVMYDLIIIGSGTAGLSAAIYGVRAGLALLVLEKNPMSGGQILNTYEVDNYLGMPGINGFDMGMQFRAHGDKLGVNFKESKVQSLERKGDIWVVRTHGEVYEAKAVILATGAEHAHLEVPGERELIGRGVSYCATCDGAFYKGRKVAVVGGGDVALEDAIYLARTCEKVYLVHRRDELRGAMILQEELRRFPNVEILFQKVVHEIKGTDVVEAVVLADVASGETVELAVDGVFIAVGIHPDTELLQGIVALDEGGYVPAGEACVTECSGIFVAGDVRKKPLRQVVTAVADGANAATAAAEYCRNRR